MAFGRMESTGNRTRRYSWTSASRRLLVSVLIVVFAHLAASEPDADRLKSNSIRAFLQHEAARRSCVDKPLEVCTILNALHICEQGFI